MAATSAAAASLVRITPSSSTFSKPSSFSAKPQRASFSACRAQKVSQSEEEQQAITRRLTLGLLAGAVAAGAKTAPASAAYGEAANIFGPPKKNTDYKTYQGDGFSIQIPSKWNPSKEKEYPGQVVRFEDNFDAVSNISVMVIPTDKKSIKDFGPVENFLSEVDFLLGKQAFFGKTISEGGFDANAVAQSSILDASTSTVNGKDYYNINLLTRTADGDEGGKHQLITATVADGKLYMCKAQAGDKRWFKGTKRLVENAANSFQVA